METIVAIIEFCREHQSASASVAGSVSGAIYTVWKLKKFILESLEKYFGTTVKDVAMLKMEIDHLKQEQIEIKKILHI